MKLIKYTAAAALLSGVASAQGLFDLNPNASESESLPLKFTAGVSFGYDDNVTPTTTGPENSSTYVKGSLGANLVVRGEQTSWDVSTTIGATNYLDDSITNDTLYNGNLVLNLNHRINDRTRLVSRNFFNYGVDLGNFYGPITSRAIQEYTYFTTDNAIGHRWTDRLATYTGVAYSMIAYDTGGRDVNSLAVYNQFRYTVNAQTTLTANTRYTMSDYDIGDADRVTVSVGIERKLSDVSTVVAKIGAQNGEQTSAYGDLSYNNQVNTQLRTRVFARYSQEDTDTIFLGGRYKDKLSLRIGGVADYTLSPKVTLTLGGNYTMSDYKEGAPLADGDWDLFNIYVGATYEINEALSLRASANHTTSDATVVPNRDYDRNRYEFGVNYAF